MNFLISNYLRIIFSYVIRSGMKTNLANVRLQIDNTISEKIAALRFNA